MQTGIMLCSPFRCAVQQQQWALICQCWFACCAVVAYVISACTFKHNSANALYLTCFYKVRIHFLHAQNASYFSNVHVNPEKLFCSLRSACCARWEHASRAEVLPLVRDDSQCQRCVKGKRAGLRSFLSPEGTNLVLRMVLHCGWLNCAADSDSARVLQQLCSAK